MPLGPLVAEILTRRTGVNGGKGGAMHISHPPSGLVLSTGIVGSGMPIAVGVGLAAQMRGADQVAVASFGDGATGTGSFHEAVNLAALWGLPVVFVCQNNRYAEMTPTAEAQPVARRRRPGRRLRHPRRPGRRQRPRRRPPGPRRGGRPGPERRGPDPARVHDLPAVGPLLRRPHALHPETELERGPPGRAGRPLPARLIGDGVLDEAGAVDRSTSEARRRRSRRRSPPPWPPSRPSRRQAFVDVYGHRGRLDGARQGQPTAPTPVTTMSMREALNRALGEALAADPTVLLIGEDLADPGGGISQVTKGLSTTYGTDRVRDTPISEAAIVGAAVGAAVAGLRPVAEVMIMDFISIALDQLVNHAAKARFMSGGLLQCPAHPAHRGVRRDRIGRHPLPDPRGVAGPRPRAQGGRPSTPADAKGLLTSCIFDDDPCVFDRERGPLRDHRPGAGGRRPHPLRASADVKRHGNDVTVVTYGRTVRDALAAAEQLAGEGIDVEVVDLRSLVPLDAGTVLGSVARTRRAVVAHHATRFAGFGAEVASLINEELFGELDAPVRRVGADFAPIGSAPALEAAVMPSAGSIADAIRDVMSR